MNERVRELEPLARQMGSTPVWGGGSAIGRTATPGAFCGALLAVRNVQATPVLIVAKASCKLRLAFVLARGSDARCRGCLCPTPATGRSAVARGRTAPFVAKRSRDAWHGLGHSYLADASARRASAWCERGRAVGDKSKAQIAEVRGKALFTSFSPLRAATVVPSRALVLER